MKSDPPNVFDRSAKRALSSWKFKPKIETLMSLETPDLVTPVTRGMLAPVASLLAPAGGVAKTVGVPIEFNIIISGNQFSSDVDVKKAVKEALEEGIEELQTEGILTVL